MLSDSASNFIRNKLQNKLFWAVDVSLWEHKKTRERNIFVGIILNRSCILLGDFLWLLYNWIAILWFCFFLGSFLFQLTYFVLKFLFQIINWKLIFILLMIELMIYLVLEFLLLLILCLLLCLSFGSFFEIRPLNFC
jgi:hypothetical protein